MTSDAIDSTHRSPIFPAKYLALDGWRGIAATLVVIDHINWITPGRVNIHIGHEAVMLFFVISGYCITAAAVSCRKKGYGFRTFMRRRVNRIYPPYMLAVLYWIVTRVVKSSAMGVNQLNRPWTDYLQNFSLTQWISKLWAPTYSPVDNPVNFVEGFWSLGYEEQFYLIVGILMVIWSFERVSLIAIATVMAFLSLSYRLILPDFRGLFIEYWAQFYCGVATFYRLCEFDIRWKRIVVDAGMVVVVLASTLALIGVIPTSKHQVKLAAELVVTAGFGIVLVFSRRASDALMNTWFGSRLMTLGLISYSLYLINQSNLVFAKGIVDRIVPVGISVWGNFIGQLFVHLGLAAVFWFVCERPFLNKSLPNSARISTE